jgi:catechol 2,3-dioxygenase-like lactoylglutathione lyase family enzyme
LGTRQPGDQPGARPARYRRPLGNAELGNLQLELWQFETPKPAPRDARPPASSLGLTHICLEVDDVDAEYERLRRAGIQFHTEPGTFGNRRATYGRDPDGNIFEILQELGE